MALPTNYVGTTLTHPVRLVPSTGGAGAIVDAKKQHVYAVPTWIYKYEITTASTIDHDGIGNDAGPNATTVAFTIDGALASGGVATFTVPRAVTATVTHGSSIVAQTIGLTGTDVYGRVITETLTITATGTSKTATSKQAFKTITAATQTAAGNASTNTVKLGDSKVLGLPFKCSSVVLVAEEEDGAAPGGGAGTVVKASDTAGNDLRGTYTPTATLNGTIDFIVWFLSDEPTEIIT